METLIDFLNNLTNKGVKFFVTDEGLRYEAETEVITNDIKNQLIQLERDIVTLSKEFPLSEEEKRLYRLQEKFPESGAFNVPVCLRLNNDFNVDTLNTAWGLVLEQYPILQSKIVESKGSLWHCIDNECETTVQQHVIDFSDEQQELMFVKEQAKKCFDLNAGPLTRIDLFTQNNRNSILLITVHNTIINQISAVSLVKSLLNLYQQLTLGEHIVVRQDLFSHQSLVAIEKTLLASKLGEPHATYWKQQLSGELPGFELLPDVPRLAVASFKGQTLIENLRGELFDWVNTYSQAQSIAPATIFLAAFQLLLHKYTHQEEIVVGVFTKHQSQQGADYLTQFTNNLPLRSRYTETLTLNEFFQITQRGMNDVVEHGNYPLSQVLTDLGISNLEKNPVFHVSYAYHTVSENLACVTELQSLGVSVVDQVSQEGNVDLGFYIVETNGSFNIHLKYNPDLYSHETVKVLYTRFCALLEAMRLNSNLLLHEYSILTSQERHQLLVDFNNTHVDYPNGKCLHELFVQQVKRTPEKIAVAYGNEQLSYQELYEKTHTLALYLQSQGVKPDSLIGICAERSVDMLVGMLGILQAGGAYVPLDPEYPDDRLAYILQDSDAAIVLTQEKLKSKLGAFDTRNTKLVALDSQWSEISDRAAELTADNIPLREDVTANHLAYIIYTSGSTGKPKGVAIEHHSPVTLVYWARDIYGEEELAGVLASTSICFDLSVYEIFLTLATGGKIILAHNALALIDLPNKESITLINTVPSAMEELIRLRAIPTSVKTINLAGEALLPTLVDKIYTHSSVEKVYDLYGPSEDTTYSTFTLRKKNSPQTIGRPIANTQVYMLDKHNNPQPIGIPGELHIAGDGLARCYLNRPELTQEKFVANPFNAGSRMYKTGDLARWLPNGTIEYLGRIDTQIKIRGFRIETGEIETQLNQYHEIKESAVVAQGDGASKKLIAFYVAKATAADNKAIAAVNIVTLSNEAIKAHLQRVMPEFMVPAAFVSLDAIPLTPNGKVNRRALESMTVHFESSHSYLAPRNNLEAQLVAMWSDILNVESGKIGVNDNFFELGGHSLLATRLISRIRSELEINLSLKNIFEQASIAQIAALIAKADGKDIPSIVPVNKAELDQLPLSFVQERLWIVDQLEPDNAAYNVPIAITITGDLEIDQLEQAFNIVIARHETLRTTFINKNGRAEQILKDVNFKVERIDLSHVKTKKARDKEARQICLAETATSFNLTTGPLIRAKVISLGKQEQILLVNMHHIISDDWALGVLLVELFSIMDAISQGVLPNLIPLPIQYVDYSIWQRKWLEDSGVLGQQLSYWQEKLAGIPEGLDLATDYPRPSVQNYAGASHTFLIDLQSTRNLQNLAEKSQATLYMTLLAAFKVLLHRYTGQEDICVGGVIANRRFDETENLIGMFVNTLALRDSVEMSDNFASVLNKVKATCLEAYENQDAPFEKIVDLVQPQRNIAMNPLFQVMVILQNVPMDALLKENVQRYPLERNTSKFDLTVEFMETAEGLSGIIEYSTALFKPTTIERMAEHLVTLCNAITSSPTVNIHDLNYISEQEKQHLLFGLNNTRADYPKDKCIHQLFAEQVKRNPKQLAVSFESEDLGLQQLSYQELYDKSHDLALYLQSIGVKPDSLIGLCVERSPDMMVGIQGILQAGGAYVPLDPEYPEDRLAYMLENSQAAIVLTQEKLKHKLAALIGKDTVLISLDHSWPEIKTHVSALKSKKIKLRKDVKPHNLAYVIYTSGSTGQPKGVMVEHKALMNRIWWMQKLYSLNSDDVVLQKTPYSFDVSVWEFVWPMMAGASVVFAVPGGHKDIDYLENVINKMKVTTLHFVPSMLNTFLDNAKEVCKSVRQVFCSGEALGRKAVDAYQSKFPKALLHNLYGPTEAAIDVTAIDCSQLKHTFVPIGAPIDNIQIYILDQNNNLQPIGVPGELHIAGDGLARGYVNRPELTQEKFIPNPFTANTRMYKSGDLARWLDDGNIEYLGRIDTQVKIRGFRIEMGEIESQLNQHTNIQDCAVVVQGKDANKQLIAFYLAKGTESGNVMTLADNELREHLQQALPDYMIPLAFVSLTEIPLTSNGKVNRRALERMEVNLQSSQNYLAPRNDIEKQLVDIWAKALNLDPANIGLDDNFFAIGGNSITVVSIASAIEKALSHKFLPVTLFKHSSIRSISQYIEDNIRASDLPAEQAKTFPSAVQENNFSEAISAKDLPEYYKDSLAIIGISCHVPDAEDHREFWKNLRQGKESIHFLSGEDAEKHSISTDILHNPSYVPTVSWMEGKEFFDPEFFKISSGNAALMDPQFRQLLLHSWKAVEDAGYVCEEIPQTSVFMSASNNYYQAVKMNADAHVMENSEEFVTWLMGQGGTIPTMISYQLGLKGPSVFVHSNCSSALTGLYSAYQSLQSKDVDYALVGAATLSASLNLGYIHQPGLNLASDGHCKTFDASADGMVEGEGVNVILLRRAVDAVEAGDHIYCLLRGISINNDGADKAGFYAPSVRGQSAVIRQVLDKTGINPETITYVEAHGTGTALGDPIELMSLSEAYEGYTNKKQFCGIGSVKPNIGHLDTAAGLIGCIKLALSLRNRKFPAIINYSKPNPQIDFKNSPFYVLDKEESWSEGSSPKRAALSAFGIGGTNAHAILEEYRYPSKVKQAEPSGNSFLIPLSAKKDDILKEYAQKLLAFISNSEQVINIAELAYTLQTGRKQMEVRIAFVVKSIEDLTAVLNAFVENKKSDNYVQGNINNDKKSVDILDDDEDFGELVKHWLEKGKIKQLAKIWVNGASLDWRSLYHGVKPLRMSLPTYPFAKEKYWIEKLDSKQQALNAQGASGIATFLHPLLHSNTSDLSQQCYSSRFDGNEIFLADHVINGKKILPAVAYLEMARAAVVQATPSQNQSSLLVLQNIVWAQPIVVAEPKQTSIALLANDSGEIEFEIYSADVEGQTQETMHCQGRAVFSDQPQPAGLDIARLQSEMQYGSVNINELYAAFTKMGTDFGPAHQGVSAIHQGNLQLLAQLSLPLAVSNTHHDYLLHPSLMDGALQACTVLIAGLNQLPHQTTLPFALESLQIISACTKEMFAWVRYSNGVKPIDKSNGRGLIKLDIDLCDLEGNICVQIRGYSARILNANTSSDTEKKFGTLLARPVWQPSSIAASASTSLGGSSSVSSQRHVILCELPDVNVRQMETLNPEIHYLQIATQRNDIADSYSSAAQTCFEKIQTIIKARPQTSVLIQVVIGTSQDAELYTGLTGLFETATLENPKIQWQMILVEPKTTPELLSKLLLSEQARPDEKLIKYEQSNRYIKRWQSVEEMHDESFLTVKDRCAFKDQGVYLITGGLGALGVLFTKEILTKTTKANIILTGRAFLSKSEIDAKTKAILKEFSTQESSIEYRQLDIANADQVTALIPSIQNKYGQLNGIIHCAGMIADNFILKKTPAEFNNVLLPKVTGTYNLDQATKNLDLDFMVLFSSESALGSVGQADYAAANGFMDQFASYRNKLVAVGQRQGQTLAINWPLWQHGGMSVDAATQASLLFTTGMQAMQTQTGIHAFYQCLALKYDQTLVIEGDLQKIRNRLFAEQEIEKSLGEVDHTAAPKHQVAKTIPASNNAQVSITAPAIKADNLVDLTQDYLRKQFSELFKIPSHQIDPQAPLENYGIDSILAINLTNQMEKTFGSLSKTLLFEYLTIQELTEYFIESFPEKLTSLFASDMGDIAPVDSSSGRVVVTEAISVDTHAEPVSELKTRLISGRRFGSQRDESVHHSPATNTKNTSTAKSRTHAHAEPVAIIGLSGRYPESSNLDEFWHNLRDGKDCIIEIPKDRWDWRDYFTEDRTKEGQHYSKLGGFIVGVDEFDPKFFNISPREAEVLDPQERIFLQHAWMAVEDAGYTRADLQIPHEQNLAGQVGVYVGVMYGEYQLLGAESSMLGKRMGFASSLADIANRVSYVLNLHGPSLTLDTMCSSSLTAIHLACQDLKSGRTDLAIAGGVNVNIHPNKYLILSSGQYISSTGHCHSFGEGGDGYIPGEGVGAVILKRLSEAEQDGDHIYGVIRGSALSHGGKTNGYTVPNLQAQASVVSQALAEADIDPRHVSYIEAHGTGTKLGDPIEIAALSKAFYQNASDKEFGFCLIGSAKSNIGHCEPAAGIAGLTKVLLQMKYQQVVPSLHSTRLNPHIDFDQTPFIVNQSLRSWDQPVIDGEHRSRIAGISSFGAGGSNAHVVVEEYISTAHERSATNDQNVKVIVPLSARTAEQLKQKAADLLSFIQSRAKESEQENKQENKQVIPSLDLQEIAFTLQVGREAMDERLGIMVSSVTQLAEKLKSYVESDGTANIEDVFRGEVKSNKKYMMNISQDDDMKEAIDKWIARKKLSKIVDLWVKGLDLDWRKFYSDTSSTAGKTRRISLPTYPFAKERYWIDVPTPGQMQITSGSSNVLHPLLHANTSDLRQQSYRTHFNGTEDFLKSNGAKKTLPAAIYLEMARAALEFASPVTQEAVIVELHNTVWGQPCVIDGSTQISIALLPKNSDARHDQQIDFEFYSQNKIEADKGDNELIHCQGNAVLSRLPAPGKLDLDRIRAQTAQNQLDPASLAHTAQSSVITTLHHGENQLLAELHLPTVKENNAGKGTDIGSYILHPDALESALQIPTILVGQQNLILASIESTRIIFACAPKMLVWVRSSATTRSSEHMYVDMDLCDMDGNVCVQMRGLSYHQTALHTVEAANPISRNVSSAMIQAPAQQVAAQKQLQQINTEVNSSKPKRIALATLASSTKKLSMNEPGSPIFTSSASSKPNGVGLATLNTVALTRTAPLAKAVITLADPAFISSLGNNQDSGSSSVNLYDLSNGIFSIHINAHDNRNSLTNELIDELMQALDTVQRASLVKVVIINGTENGFLLGGRQHYNDAVTRKLYHAIISFPYPVIAAMSGDAMGAGFLFGALCDFMICGEQSQYSYIESDLDDAQEKLYPTALEDNLFRARFGDARAHDFLYLSAVSSGRQLKDSGWTCRIVSAEKVEDAARDLAAILAKKPQAALSLLKQHLARNLIAIVDQLQIVDVVPVVEEHSLSKANKKITSPSKNIKLEHPAEKVLLVRMGKVKKANELATLVKNLKNIFKQAQENAQYSAIVLASDSSEFISVATSETRNTVLDFQNVVLESNVPVIAALEGNAKGVALLMSQFCDACIYSKNGVYSFGNNVVQNHDIAKTAAIVFAQRFGNYLGKEILLAGMEYSGIELQQKQKNIKVYEKSQVISAAIELAEVWVKQPLSALASWKKQETLNIQEKLKNLPAWLEQDDHNSKVPTLLQNNFPVLVSLNSNVVSATLHSDGILVVKMEDKQAKNMHSDAILDGLNEVFTHINQTSEYKVIVITGYDTYFSTGGTKEDLVAIQEGKAKFTDVKIYHLAMACKLPVIAAMQGHAIGAGWALGMFADFVFFSDEGRYLSPYLNFGFTPGAGATFVFPEKIGYDLARETLLTAQESSGSELKDRGLLIPVLPRSQVPSAALTLAVQIAKNNSRVNLIALKHQMTEHLHKPLEETYELELAMHDKTLVGQSDALEQINNNFLEGKDIQSAKEANQLPVSNALVESVKTTNAENVNKLQDTQALSAIPMTLKKLLAQELHMEEGEIDEDAQFVDIGLDSIYGVTWVRKINETYQLSIEAIKVYSYPTLSEFSGYVKEEVLKKGAVTNVPPVNADISHTAVISLTPPVPEAAPISTSSNYENFSVVSATLKKLLAQELHMDESEIDEDAQFVDIGLDSIYGVTWVRKINETYKLSIEAIKVYSYPTLNEFSKYVQEEVAKHGAVNAPVITHSPETRQTSVPANKVVTNAVVPAVSLQSMPAPIRIATVNAAPVYSDASGVTAALKKLLAQELHMEESEIDEEAQFVDIGLDSIYGVTWVRKINEAYQLSIEAIKVYSYPTLKEFGLYVAQEAEKNNTLPVTSVAAPVTIEASKPVAIPVPTQNFIAPLNPNISSLEVKQLISWRKQALDRTAGTATTHLSNPIAVIGMAGQFPQANNLAKFWQNIAEGKNCINEVPDNRWNTNDYYRQGDATAGKTNAKWFGALEEYDLFDPLFFNISPIEAETMDPQQRIFLQACWSSIENAGYDAQSLSGSKCGVFVGSSTGDYNLLSPEELISAQGFTGSATSILAARISYFLNLRGPCLTIDTACSSSLVAIANACDSLNSANSDMALAGGVYVMAGPYMHIKTAQSGMLSADGKCFAFDQRANGFVPGEGVGVVMLKRLADAERDKDIIQGVIQGWGVNQDGKTNGITAPNAESQTRLQQDVYDKYRINPADIQLIEAHGTGTKLGDPIEVEGLKASFKKYTLKKDYCALGSVKSNIGHCLAAAGIAGVIKVILAIKHKQLPPTIHFEKLNEHIGLKDSPFFINDQLQDWKVDGAGKRQAAISSFGFSGTNAHMVVAEYLPLLETKLPVNVITQNSDVMIPLSAKTPDQLRQRAADLLQFIREEKSIDFLEMSYTLQVGREAMEERLGIMASSIEQLSEKLQAYVADDSTHINDVYRGQVKRNKESMRLLVQDNDVKETIVNKCIGDKNLSKLLDLWAKGLMFDWNKLYGETKPQRINLPVYPFAKERYWKGSVGLGLISSAPVISQNILHPLLHTNTSDFSQQSYATHFNGEEFFLKDHQINIHGHPAQKVLPGVAYLEMVRAAVEKAMPAAQASTTLELRNTAWVQPVVVNESKQITIALFANDSDGHSVERIDYEIYSHNNDAEDPFEELVHCQGQAVITHQAVLTKLDINGLMAQMQRGKLQAKDVYDIFIKNGISYGPSHQGISILHLGNNQVLAQLSLPAIPGSDRNDYVLHPSLLDSALQACVGLDSDLDIPGKPSVPFALETLRIISPCTEEMFAWVRYAPGSKSADKVAKFNIDLCDQQGNICVQMHGFSTRIIEGKTESLRQQTASETSGHKNNFTENIVPFDDDFYQEIIERVLNSEISVDDAVELG